MEEGLAVGCEGEGDGDGGGASAVVMAAPATAMAVSVATGLAAVNESGAGGAGAGGGGCVGRRWRRPAATSHIRIAMRHSCIYARCNSIGASIAWHQREHALAGCVMCSLVGGMSVRAISDRGPIHLRRGEKRDRAEEDRAAPFKKQNQRQHFSKFSLHVSFVFANNVSLRNEGFRTQKWSRSLYTNC